jgi:mRNA-degrading endonuclease RelE of RelBE toxin-antitoxin system
VKKTILLSVGLLLLFSACALFPHRGRHISWPEQIIHIEAMCELDMSWRGMKYNGSMSLTMNYPSRFQIEIYGPFGDTLMFLKKNNNDFLLATKEERFTDAHFFEDRFGIKLKDFIDDLAMMSKKDGADKGNFFVQRHGYRVIYKLDDHENAICWEGRDGKICIRFLEAKFDGKDLLEKGSDQDV